MAGLTFTMLPKLPLEIRRKIWAYTLPGPRVLLIKQKAGGPKRISRNDRFTANPTICPASYGGHQPAILSVNRESRAEALRYLTPLFQTDWNLEIDTPYFELPEGDNSRNEVLLITLMRKAGQHDMFKHLAIDWLIWRWKTATGTMEYQFTFGTQAREAYEHPIQTLIAVPNLKTCAFVHSDHTLQKDLIEPYVCWRLGPLSTKTTLDGNVTALNIEEASAMQDIDAKRGEIENIGYIKTGSMTIFDREREYLPPNRLRRSFAGWETDWFG